MLSLLAAVLINSQVPDYQSKLQREEMTKLDFIVGYWEGTITYNNNGTDVVFKGYENRRKTSGGTAIIVDASYTLQGDPKNTAVVDFSGIIRFDTKRKKHVRFYQLSNGDTEEVQMEVWDRGYGYEVPSPSTDSKVQYFMNLQADGTFVEIGNLDNGDEPLKLMETRLKKVAKN